MLLTTRQALPGMQTGQVEGRQLTVDTDRNISTDAATLYRSEIRRIDLLSAGAVTLLAQAIEAGQREALKPRANRDLDVIERGEEAQGRLTEANLRLVMRIARRYQNLGVDLLDLIQEGNLGLIRAVEKFDWRKGFAFSSYAIWWIRNFIMAALVEQASTIHVPLYKVEEIKRLRRVRQRLQQRMEGEPTLEDLAVEMGISVEEVVGLLTTKAEAISLDRSHQTGEGDETSLHDLLEDDPKYSPEGEVMAGALHGQLQQMLQQLPLKERRVLELRYGWNGQDEHSLPAAGRKVGLSHEAVRQIEFRALRLLRPMGLACGLNIYLHDGADIEGDGGEAGAVDLA
jgi:RNA polymerase primary sigma factor